MSLFTRFCGLASLTPFLLVLTAAHAGTPSAPVSSPGIIPFSELGARATAEDRSGSTGITPGAEGGGAVLRSGFQKLAGEVTAAGLWLRSTESTAAAGGTLHLRADSVGRAGGVQSSLAQTGAVTSDTTHARWARPGLVEEYSVSADGVRQDFILPAAPAGQGDLSVDLALSGARAEARSSGVRLTMDVSERVLLYSRLRVVDARGRLLRARLSVPAPTRLRVQVQDTGAQYPLRIDPTFSDADWVSISPGMAGVDGTVSAIVVDGSGNLYVGGNFTRAGNVQASCIVRWDGSSWSALGSGVQGGSVTSLAMMGGHLYVAGAFSAAGDLEAQNIARWDGTTWSTLGSGLDLEVYALAVSGSALYVGGAFSSAGGKEAAGIARWSSGKWSPLGAGVSGVVNAIAVRGSSVYAGGSFDRAGSVDAAHIARWNGSTWSALGSGTDYDITSLALIGSTLYAGGSFTMAGDVEAANIAQWNGRAWSALGTGLDSVVYVLAVKDDQLYAGGGFTSLGGEIPASVARWDGSTWTSVCSEVQGGIYALAFQGNELHIGGSFDRTGDTWVGNISRYKADAWSVVGPGINSYVYALAVSGSHLYAGGTFTQIGDVRADHIARWDGSTWSPLGSGLQGWMVSAITVDGSDVYVGGDFHTAGDQSASNIAQWNGSTWSALGQGTSGNVQALAFSGGYLYAAGEFLHADDTLVYHIARWDGEAWSSVGGGMNMFGYVRALAVSGTDLYAGGIFTSAGGTPASRVARWDGHTWSALSSGVSGVVSSLAVDGTDLYVGGRNLTSAGSVPVKNIARWDGTFWSALGMGVQGSFNEVAAMAVHDGSLYVGGLFDYAGTTPASCIARWDGSTWFPLGSGLRGGVTSLAVGPGDHLYVSGSFQSTHNVIGPDPVFSPYIIQANLNGAPDITVFGEEHLPSGAGRVSMGTVALPDAPVTRSLSINNLGTTTLNLTGTPRVTLRGSPAFTVPTQPTATITPNTDAGFQIAFDPATPGLHQASVTVASDDPDTPVYTIAVEGIGLAAPLAQTITFTPPAYVYESEYALQLVAEASSGLPVQFTLISGPATAASLQDGTLAHTGPGTIKVQASQPGGGLYKAATPVVRTIQVKPDPTPPSFVITSLLQRYDGQEKGVYVVGSETVDEITYKVGGVYTPTGPTDAGSYPVKVVAGTTTKTATLVITKAPLLIIPDDQQKAAGQPNPPLTYSVVSYDVYRDPQEVVFTKPPVLTTKATPTSPGGLYPITASGATAVNYSFIYLPAHLTVTTFAGDYEALLTGEDGHPVGKLSLTLTPGGQTFSARLITCADPATATVSFASGSLQAGPGGWQTTGSATTLVTSGSAKVPWRLNVTLPRFGPLTVHLLRDGNFIGRAKDGSKLLSLPASQTVPYAGTHTLLLEPALPAHLFVPAGSGWATATIGKNGGITYAGKLADGTAFTATTLPDEAPDPRHRLFLHPYKATRPQVWLAGSFSLTPHPVLAGRRHVPEGLLTWRKDIGLKDPLYRGLFGPVTTALLLDPWLPPSTKAPAVTLAQRLGLTGSSLGVTHEDTGSASHPDLPVRLSLGTVSATTASVSVLTPVANLTKWTTKTFSPANGTFTGSFELTDRVSQGSPLKRTVHFSGILRQPASAGDPLIGAGHYILPPPTSVPDPDNTWSRELRLTRP
ncbi:MBG domain-containing protein [Brevifollis gellanilyticus]|uniref:Uncharacterized protein n=1 Tax=Brevifollis gellanilyticus TaxID=748831 RepID=A0A512MI51_9BACT|nr:MBG domain-containing protein [Brevifollis gellanilyticus]GEP46415.1 hypothetical protein BGE01nite_57060 [Brevifollis gellanilyticus]